MQRVVFKYVALPSAAAPQATQVAVTPARMALN